MVEPVDHGQDHGERVPGERVLQVVVAQGQVGLPADRLSISYTTVDTHVAHIYEKLEVRNAPSAVNKAHRLGLFPLDDK